MKATRQTHIKVTDTSDFVAEFPGCKLIGDNTVNLTSENAYKFLEYDSFVGERPVRERHVQFLYDEYKSGRFLWNLVCIVVGVVYEKQGGDLPPVKRVFRLNGQHCCWMRVNIKDKNIPACKVRQLIYECETMDGVRAIYSSIDRGAGRSQGHITKVIMSDNAAAAGIPISYLAKLSGGFRLWQWESPQDRKRYGTPSEVSAMLSGKYADLFRTVGGFYQNNMSSWMHIGRSPIMAALYATFQRDPEKAHEFWSAVCTGLGFTRKEDPRLQLRNWTESHAQNVASDKETTSAEDLYRVAVNLWNKWRKGEHVSVVRGTDERVKAV